MADIITEVKRIRAGVLKRDAAELKRVIDQYRVLYDRLKGDIAALEADLAKGGYTAAGVKKLASYRRLLQDIRREMDDYSAWLRSEVKTLGRASITAGIKDARYLLGVQDERLLAVFRTLQPAQIEQLLGFLDPRGELYKRLALMGEYTAQKVSEAILRGVALGMNPATIAKQMVRDKLGIGLVDAMRTARTVQLWAYREANRASYIANADVVEGWEWYAELDESTCTACLSLHGSIHKLDEVMDGHYNCRCTPIPVVIGGERGQTGEDWFKQQPEATQRAMMGDARYDAWQAGKFDFADMATRRDDDVYGTMQGETPLKDLIPE